MFTAQQECNAMFNLTFTVSLGNKTFELVQQRTQVIPPSTYDASFTFSSSHDFLLYIHFFKVCSPFELRNASKNVLLLREKFTPTIFNTRIPPVQREVGTHDTGTRAMMLSR